MFLNKTCSLLRLTSYSSWVNHRLLPSNIALIYQQSIHHSLWISQAEHSGILDVHTHVLTNSIIVVTVMWRHCTCPFTNREFALWRLSMLSFFTKRTTFWILAVMGLKPGLPIAKNLFQDMLHFNLICSRQNENETGRNGWPRLKTS